MEAPPNDPEVGDTLGGYRVEALLGEGGMGKVFRARRVSDGELVALKVLRPSLAGDRQYAKRFRREAHAAASVRHPHVVPLIDVAPEGEQPYIVQRFISGGTLEGRLKRGAPMPLPDVVKTCLQVAAGIDALHAAGFIHRDLKPANILFDERGAAYVADLGLAKDPGASVLTKPGTAVGSMDYMAPEAIRGEEVDGRADVYALGCVMTECLRGRPPFADREGMKVLWAHLQDPPPDPCADRTDVPPELGWAVLSALEKDPEKRPPTATAYARMVQLASGMRSVKAVRRHMDAEKLAPRRRPG